MDEDREGINGAEGREEAKTEEKQGGRRGQKGRDHIQDDQDETDLWNTDSYTNTNTPEGTHATCIAHMG